MALLVTFLTEKGAKKSMRIDDLEFEVLEAICKVDADATRMWDISQDPFANTYRTYAVLDALADALGIEHVERNLSPRTLEAMLEIVPNADEIPVEDGYPQVPGETEDGSSSTSPGPLTTGLQASPDNSGSETS